MRERKLRQKSDVFFNQNHCRNEHGQSVILVTIIIMSFMMFFTFCLNTGILINAKISVQAAADAAAYAGAATQARQLNSISYLNYDMRQQLKKLIFRNVFVGSMSSHNFPTPAVPGGFYDFPKADYLASTMGTMVPIKVPVICVSVSPAGSVNENCTFINQRNSAYDVRQTMGVTGSTMSAITQQLVNSMNNIANTQNRLCQTQSGINFFVALQWLFRGDVSESVLDDYMDTLVTQITDQNLKTTIKDRVKGLVEGLGIYPRNIISMLRAETLRGFINEPPLTGMTKEDIESLEAPVGNAEAKERSILSFRSALSNLNHNIFDPERLTVDEIMPSNAFSLTPLTVSFNFFVQMMEAGAPAPANSQITCKSEIFAFPVIGVPVGVRWDQTPAKELSYAVRVRAYVKPRGLLFMPGSQELELQAVAGAKPFGSRIGKRILSAANEYTVGIQPPLINGQSIDMNGTINNLVPNVRLGAGGTMLDVDFLRELKQIATGGGAVFTSGSINNAQRHAMAPNPEEVGHYNIIPPPHADIEKYKYEFLPYAGQSGNDRIYRLYAPLYPAGGGGDPNTRIKAFIDQVFPSTGIGPNRFGIDMSTLGAQVFDTVRNYVGSQLTNGTGENSESISFAAIELPMRSLSPPTVTGRPFWLTTAREVMTSWAPGHVRMSRSPANPPDFGFQPRFGFSVKFVALRDLINKGLPDDEGDLGSVTH